jgi:1-acyl-sn-glycerol-3-phosphate acyltransferase
MDLRQATRCHWSRFSEEIFSREGKSMYAIIRWIATPLMHALACVHISGQENTPAEGPLLMVSNHLSRMDPPLILISVPRPLHVFAARKYRTNPFFFILFNLIGVIWVRQWEADREALRQAANLLRKGGGLGMAPEGTRSQETRGLIRARGGAAFVASRTGASILPVAVWGTEAMIPAMLHLRRVDIWAKVGKPFRLEVSPHARGPELEAATDTIMRAIAELLPPEYRGEYGGENGTA